MTPMRIAPMAAIAVLTASAALAQQHTVVEREATNVLRYDELLRRAQAKARATLPVFLAKWQAHAPGASDYQVRVALPSRAFRGGDPAINFYGRETEYFWITMDGLTPDGRISGRLITTSTNSDALKAGSPVEVAPSSVTDWMYVSAGRIYGQYTTRVNLARMPRSDREKLQAVLAPNPLEPGAD